MSSGGTGGTWGVGGVALPHDTWMEHRLGGGLSFLMDEPNTSALPEEPGVLGVLVCRGEGWEGRGGKSAFAVCAGGCGTNASHGRRGECSAGVGSWPYR